MPYILKLANQGWRQALAEDEHLLRGLNVHAGKLTNAEVGEALNLDFVEPSQVL
ncbi:hypothetical protein [Acidihalobacter prosperus]